MPLWNVYCTKGIYSAEDKRAFAEAITDIYAGEVGGLAGGVRHQVRDRLGQVVVAGGQHPAQQVGEGG